MESRPGKKHWHLPVKARLICKHLAAHQEHTECQILFAPHHIPAGKWWWLVFSFRVSPFPLRQGDEKISHPHRTHLSAAASPAGHTITPRLPYRCSEHPHQHLQSLGNICQPGAVAGLGRKGVNHCIRVCSRTQGPRECRPRGNHLPVCWHQPHSSGHSNLCPNQHQEKCFI